MLRHHYLFHLAYSSAEFAGLPLPNGLRSRAPEAHIVVLKYVAQLRLAVPLAEDGLLGRHLILPLELTKFGDISVPSLRCFDCGSRGER